MILQSQHGHNDEKPGERSGHSYIEDLSAGKERRTDPNHCTKGAKWIQGQHSQPGDGNNGRGRNDIGQGAADAVETAGQIMPHLMGQQDRQQRQREGQALEESQRILKGIE